MMEYLLVDEKVRLLVLQMAALKDENLVVLLASLMVVLKVCSMVPLLDVLLDHLLAVVMAVVMGVQ